MKVLFIGFHIRKKSLKISGDYGEKENSWMKRCQYRSKRIIYVEIKETRNNIYRIEHQVQTSSILSESPIRGFQYTEPFFSLPWRQK